jgi:stage V sporulation protein AF
MTKKTEQKWPIPESVNEIEHFMKQRVGLGISFDLNLRKLKILKKDVHLYSVSGLVDTVYTTQINQSVQPVENLDELVDKILSGLIGVVIEGERPPTLLMSEAIQAAHPKNRILRRSSGVPVMALSKISL